MSLPAQKRDLALWSPTQIDGYLKAVRQISDLRLFVLLRHIALTEWLRSVLARRLNTDTLPQIQNFSTLAGIALAGSWFEKLRHATGLFNEARNEIAHKMYTTDPRDRLAEFVRLLDSAAWPDSEDEQINAVSSAVGTLMVEVEQALVNTELHRRDLPL